MLSSVFHPIIDLKCYQIPSSRVRFRFGPAHKSNDLIKCESIELNSSPAPFILRYLKINRRAVDH